MQNHEAEERRTIRKLSKVKRPKQQQDARWPRLSRGLFPRPGDGAEGPGINKHPKHKREPRGRRHKAQDGALIRRPFGLQWPHQEKGISFVRPSVRPFVRSFVRREQTEICEPTRDCFIGKYITSSTAKHAGL